MTGPAECYLCRAVSRVEAASVVFENDRVVGLVAQFPIADGHALVVPKEHCSSLNQLDERVGQEMFRQAHRLAQCLREISRPSSLQLVMNDIVEGTHRPELFHVHLHVIPELCAVSAAKGVSIAEAALTRRHVLDRLAIQMRDKYASRFGMTEVQ